MLATNPQAAQLSYAIVTNPTRGSLAGFDAQAGTITYTPDPDSNGEDSFTYRASHGNVLSNVATVSLKVEK